MTRLVESVKIDAKGKGRVWWCRLISEGQGSSAFYPGEILAEYGPKALPKGTHVYFNHPTETESWERNGSRDIRDYAGVLQEDPVYKEDEKALYAPVKFTSEALPLVEDAYEDIALSIDIRKFELEEDENANGVVKSLGYSPLNNVGIVPRGGRDGKIISLVESYREMQTERKPMTEEEIKALAESIVSAIVPALTEALTPEPVEDKPESVDLAGVLEEAYEAGLPKGARRRVAQAAEAGEDYKALIEAEKADLDDIKGSLQESMQGDYQGGVTDYNDEFSKLSIFGGDK